MSLRAHSNSFAASQNSPPGLRLLFVGDRDGLLGELLRAERLRTGAQVPERARMLREIEGLLRARQ